MAWSAPVLELNSEDQVVNKLKLYELGLVDYVCVVGVEYKKSWSLCNLYWYYFIIAQFYPLLCFPSCAFMCQDPLEFFFVPTPGSTESNYPIHFAKGHTTMVVCRKRL